MHLSAVDLNLLVVLDALLETQSIKDASRRLALSPSATSHALARLRMQFEDELLTRAGKRMVPTARALRLRVPLRSLLDGAQTLLQSDDGVKDPADLKRTFVMGAHDFFELVTLPALLSRLESVAPGVDLAVRPMTEYGVPALRNGEYDLAIGVFQESRLPDDIQLQPLLSSRLVCLLRKGHPALSRRWTVKRFADLAHVLVSPRGRGRGIVDDRLDAVGLERRVRCTVSSFSSAPALVAASDCVLTISEHVADVFADRYDLVSRPPPLPIPSFTVSAAWHARLANDAEVQWLVEQLVDLNP